MEIASACLYPFPVPVVLRINRSIKPEELSTCRTSEPSLTSYKHEAYCELKPMKSELVVYGKYWHCRCDCIVVS